MAALYAFDSNVFIRALRDPARMAALRRFRMRAGTRMRANAVVALELRAGARTPAMHAAVNDLIAVYSNRSNVVIPSLDAYLEAGRVLSALAAAEGVDVSRAGSLVNDVMIATSCREGGVCVITENVACFSAVQRHLRGFKYLAADDVL